MNHTKIILVFIFFLGCNKAIEKSIDKDLVKHLQEMVKVDQFVASYAFPPKEYNHFSQKQWERFKDSVYRTNEVQLQKIFNDKGFVGYDIGGEKGSKNFWLLVQHCDHNPAFQNEVLQKMKLEVTKNNANAENYAFLTDRVKINTGEKQIYGTQVAFNSKIAQAYPIKLKDSINVNKRRKAIGLEPLEKYLDEATLIHFEMNKEAYLKMGIKAPKLYIKKTLK